ncbi:rod shape-determining protein MreD [Bacillus aquiflavi]|uniref:Rod shape-determining protein MreD n=1 Tax=Bacillus aquiflavi TaxID=2672567 RepID=A0A6B3VU03_9BACI|nr:rod shape-determining protein MreD [Bacillus aquiflavi]MBA4537201.1 rod shape-determining protein MreD [Bacillus aquiflavi]NEY81459.1 rod shape-determining protein MreD [Bacillus aquiflavi]
MRKFLLPALFTVVFVSESIFVEVASAEIFNSDRIFVPRFLLAFILFLTIYANKETGIFYGAIFGMLYDVVYTEILGIYLFLFPLIAYIVSKVMKVLQANVIVSVIVTIIGITILEIVVYEINFLIHMTEMNFSNFAAMRLFPTLVLNLAFIIIFAYPLKKQFEKLAIEF